MLRIFLRHLDEWTLQRREAAARYRELGLGDLVEVPEDEPGHVYHLFVCRSPQRDAICAALAERGIATGTYYEPPLHLQPALAYLDYGLDSLPVTEQLARDNFSVPIWAGIDADTQEQVVDAVREALKVEVGLNFPISKHRLWQVAVDAGLIAAAWYLAFQLRFDNGIPIYYDTLFERSVAIVIGVQLVTFVASASTTDGGATCPRGTCGRPARGVTVACVISSLVVYFANPVLARAACRARSRSWTSCSCSRSSPARACSPAR